ncbi:jg17889 [Pararge aegeria aegeria]|uniref:Jg17889 protein n=1 Tax=Pararge aegeria aegeria TaxID=348720 RepID=A0A8S4SQR6_9NEOP|nr:jg17889 [Pararge aegeria aegeria]
MTARVSCARGVVSHARAQWEGRYRPISTRGACRAKPTTCVLWELNPQPWTEKVKSLHTAPICRRISVFNQLAHQPTLDQRDESKFYTSLERGVLFPTARH